MLLSEVVEQFTSRKIECVLRNFLLRRYFEKRRFKLHFVQTKSAFPLCKSVNDTSPQLREIRLIPIEVVSFALPQEAAMPSDIFGQFQ